LRKIKSYKTLAVTLRLPGDEDILEILESLPGPASPWVREAIRAYAKQDKFLNWAQKQPEKKMA